MYHKRFFSVLVAFIAVFLICVNCFADDEVFVQGVRTDSSYTNETIGIRIDLTDDFVMATDEEIMQMMQIGMDNMLDSEQAKELIDIANITVLYEMLATNLKNNSTIVLIAEKPMLSGIKQEQYVEANIEQIKEYMQVDTVEQDTVEMCGKNWDIIAYEVDVSGVSLNYFMLIRKVGDRFVMLDFTVLDEESLDELISLVSCY